MKIPHIAFELRREPSTAGRGAVQRHDVLMLLAVEKQPLDEAALAAADRLTEGFLSQSGLAADAAGKAGQMWTSNCPAGRARRIAILGLGPADKLRRPVIRQAGAALARWMRNLACRRVITAVQAGLDRFLPANERLQAFVEGLLDGNFQFDEYKTKPADPAPPDRLTLTIAGGDETAFAALADAARLGQALSEARSLARYVGHQPGNAMPPAELAALARRVAGRDGLRCRVLDERQLARERCHAILAVGAAAKHPPRLIVLEHGGRGRGASGSPVTLVGKGITFDSGGLQLKSTDNIVGMKYDKCGAAAVLGAISAIARLKYPRPVVGIIAAAENAISAEAYRPDDIIRTRAGKTVEIASTDAEGRLVLADALDYARRYKPAAMIDLATLTGGIRVALGDAAAGLMSNDDTLAAALVEAGERCGERCWRLPIYDRYVEQTKGKEADLRNSAGREAQPLTAAAFLQAFVQNGTPWAHLDIAGVARAGNDGKEAGASGYGVGLLVEYLRTALAASSSEKIV